MDNNSFSLESMFSKLNSNIIIQSIIRIWIIVVICLVIFKLRKERLCRESRKRRTLSIIEAILIGLVPTLAVFFCTEIHEKMLEANMPNSESAIFNETSAKRTDDDDYSNVSVRQQGTVVWSGTVKAKAGDIIEGRIVYHNPNDHSSGEVLVIVHLPDCLKYIPHSTSVENPLCYIPESLTSDRIADDGIYIGEYIAKSKVSLYFRIEVSETGTPGQDEAELVIDIWTNNVKESYSAMVYLE